MPSSLPLSFLSRLLLAGLLVPAFAPASAHAAKTKTRTDLVATASVPGASGVARLVVRKPSRGGFGVQVFSLRALAKYDVLVGGVRVASLETDDTGHGRVRFSSGKVGESLVLGFDPRGASIEIRDDTGADVLTGNVAAPAGSEADKACCVPDDGGTECEDRTPADCAALGGTSSDAGSCMPDPCGGTHLPPVDTVCCVPGDSGATCEDRTQIDCMVVGGSIVEADSCDGDPCSGAPPSPDQSVQCCVAAYYVWACEDHTVAECDQLGGINKGPGSCSPNPCGVVPPSTSHGVCCLPNAAGDEIECEDRAASDCTAAGGVVKTTGSVCDASTCADVLPPNPDVMCCVAGALGGETECEDLTTSDCTGAGGVNMGPGVCGIDTCASIVVPEPTVMCCEHGGKDNALRCEDRTLARCISDGGTSLGEGACPAVDPCAGN